MNFKHLLADRTGLMGTSAIREILKVVGKPGMISLAGGIPAPESFPMSIIRKLTEKVLNTYGSSAFQYDLTEGFKPLQEQLSVLLAERDIKVSAHDINISSGSQGTLDAMAKILITRGDKIAVEAPTYLGAISAFNPYEPEYVPLETDALGLIPESLDQILSEQSIKFIYLVPTFQNPTGRTIPTDRRKKIAEIIIRHRALLVEDDPYSSLRYKGEPVPAIKTLAPDNVVYVSTLSKVFAPGLRIGFFTAPEMIREWLVLVKQGTDLHTSTFNQALAAEYLKGGYLKQHLPEILKLYQPKQAAMFNAISRYFPENFFCSPSDGGMFLWVEGPKGTDIDSIFQHAIKHNVAFVPGKYFFTDSVKGRETMRLNYTMCDERTLDRAIKTLSDVIRDCQN